MALFVHCNTDVEDIHMNWAEGDICDALSANKWFYPVLDCIMLHAACHAWLAVLLGEEVRGNLRANANILPMAPVDLD